MPKQLEILPHLSGGFSGAYVEKQIVDMEMGRKPGWHNSAFNENELEGPFSSDESHYKDAEFDNTSPAPNLSSNLDTGSAEVLATLQPRRSSWGRRSGSWNLPSEVLSTASQVGDSNRVSGVNAGNLTSNGR